MGTGTSTILVVANNEAFGTALQREMTQYGYQVLVVKNEQTALDESFQQLPAMVLVNREQFLGRLPALIHTLWRNPSLKQVPIVTIADPLSYCSEEECADDLDYGFHAYLCNMTFRLTVAYARAILRTIQYSKCPREVLEVGNIRMDLARHELCVENKMVELTPREFMIMKEFMERPGVVVSRTHLINRVWGEDYALVEHSLDVHIHALRKKIERCPPKPVLIVTVRGFGYKLGVGGREDSNLARRGLAKISKSARSDSNRFRLLSRCTARLVSGATAP